MDPYTGEILALANYPTSTRTRIATRVKTQRRNRAMQDLYEPGSTFKIVTASAALEERVATPATIIDASAGNIRFGTRVIRDDHNYGVLSFADVIVKSSNVGAIKVGAASSVPEKVSDYVQALRLRQADLAGLPRREPRHRLGSRAGSNDSALASVAMGYQVGVTPLQMAAAVSAVANGGELRAAARGARRDPRRRAAAGAAQGASPRRSAATPPPR